MIYSSDELMVHLSMHQTSIEHILLPCRVETFPVNLCIIALESICSRLFAHFCGLEVTPRHDLEYLWLVYEIAAERYLRKEYITSFKTVYET